MQRANLPPYLTTVGGKKVCSVCGLEFPKGVKPSLSQAFADHFRQVHKNKPKDKDKPPRK
jgi:hypothetical protein